MALEVPGGRSILEVENYPRPRGRVPLPRAAHGAIGAALAEEVRQPDTVRKQYTFCVKWESELFLFR